MDNELRNRLHDAREQGQFDELPPSGHQMRFREKLLDTHEQKTKRRVLPMWAIGLAAALLVFLISALVVYNIDSANDSAASSRGLADVSVEMNQMEHYYVDQINQRTAKLDLADPDINSLVKRYKKLEEDYEQLTIVLNKDFDNEKVIDAMIENYQLRLRILEGIKMKMELNDKTKTRNDDSTNA